MFLGLGQVEVVFSDDFLVKLLHLLTSNFHLHFKLTATKYRFLLTSSNIFFVFKSLSFLLDFLIGKDMRPCVGSRYLCIHTLLYDHVGHWMIIKIHVL